MNKYKRKFRKMRRNINKDVAEAGLLILYLGLLHECGVGIASIVSGSILLIAALAKYIIPVVINKEKIVNDDIR